ncbi:Aste57867_19623 [Aphanomyces stellatus]|uniref:Aste57867_19623 protein n=1 Tax=Aphanomyces stellatus TaxID=120398 RepID=A0A485LEJ4_9STRA|nr:hypothetical protein As57867_019558 [Aphanomyces stellatus]VFT96323.1 Aste57867_19623 [Aphanomyces stellatus]
MQSNEVHDAETEVFLHDLQFLIATDEQIQDDFSHLCELLADSDASETTDPTPSEVPFTLECLQTMPHSTTADRPTAPLKPTGVSKGGSRNAFQYRQRQEIMALKTQVEGLKAQLASASQDKTSALMSRKRDASPWEMAARDELLERNRAVAENKHLKDMLVEQATFVEQMQHLFVKKPRLMAASTDPKSHAWHEYKLAAQKSLRAASIHAIADRQLRRLQHAFIQANLFQSAQADGGDAAPRILSDGSVLMEFKRKLILPIPMSICGAAVWRIMKTYAPVATDAHYTSEAIDDRTVYQTFSQHVGGLTLHSNAVRKYYHEPSRQVVLWRNVLEDVLVPHMSRGAVSNEWGWVVAEPLNPSVTALTCLVQVVAADVGRDRDAVVAELNQGIARYGFRFRGHEDPAVEMQNPVMAAFMESGKRFQTALKDGMAQAIAEYHHARSSTT